MRTAATRSKLITPALLRRWPLPDVDGVQGKEDRGCALIVGGSVPIPGAVILAATAALRAGAGMLQVATVRAVASAVAISLPEARVIGLATDRQGELASGSCRAIQREASRCDALLIGPGMMSPTAGTELLKTCLRLKSGGPTIVVDAAPLKALRRAGVLPAQRGGKVILTPHAGEMATLWGWSKARVLAAPEQVAREAAGRLRAVIVLKGPCTYVVAPDGKSFHNTAGNSGLGTSGSGDALSGLIAGLCARGADPLQAAIWGVYLHARAGDSLARKIGPLGFLARELLAEIPRLMARWS
jgi:hydroxyethylthiazole kinase-like uncharacterized protein yjeF